MRVAITGPPRSGKTTLAKSLGDFRSTDSVKHLTWGQDSEAVATWFSRPGDLIVEGVVVPRALRKWLREHQGPPVDELIVIISPKLPLSPGQLTMAKGVFSVLREIVPELLSRGVKVSKA